MKKIFAAVVAALMLPVGTVTAQTQWGVVAGMNLSKVNFSNNLEEFVAGLSSKNMTGFYAGPMVNVKFPFLGFGCDAALIFSQKKLNAESTGTTVSTFRSIEIPVNLRYTIKFSRHTAGYLAVGPQFGVNVGHRNWDFSDVNTILNDIKFKKRAVNISMNVGGGVKLFNFLELGVFYNMALSKYYKETATEDYDLNSNSLQIQAALLF